MIFVVKPIRFYHKDTFMKYIDPFVPDQYYHLFNHAVGNELLFRCEGNYFFFLNKFTHYMLPVAATYAYCLMPNHFHFLVQFRDRDIILKYAQSKAAKTIELHESTFDFHKFLMQQLSNFLNSYTKSLNKVYERRGALFLDYTRRVQVTHPVYLRNLVCYIHNNPVKHGFCLNAEDWKFSSYSSLMHPDKTSKLERSKLQEWFNGDQSIREFHRNKEIYIPDDYLME